MAEQRMSPDAALAPALTWDRVRSYVKLEHTLFSVPVLLSAALLASGGWPDWGRLLVVLLAAAGARTAGMSLNRIVDRAIDARNPRTAVRELPSGKMHLGHAGVVTLAGLLVYVAGAAWLGRVCLALSPIPVLVFWGYPYLKRFTPLAHFGVGLSLSLAPVGAYLAMRPDMLQTLRGVWPLALFTFFWVSGFDIIYATLDVEFDRGEGLRSLPADLGLDRALAISGLLHALALACLAALVAVRWNHPSAWLMWGVCAVLLFLEHRHSRDVDLAFFRFNAWISFAVLGLALAGVFLRP
jgi:4-hydroxybenzoate polyprenyltransferase